MTSDDKISIKLRIEKDSPLELTALANALLSLNNSIDEFVSKQTGITGTKTTLQSVEKGSDVFNMVVFGVGGALAIGEFLPTINAYFEFFSNIKNIGKRSVDEIKQDPFLTPNMLLHLENIINLTDKEKVSLELTSPVFNNCIFINQDNKESYKQGLNTARQIRDDQNKEQVKKVFDKMSITLYQTTNTDKNVKFKAFCYELSDKAIPILIDDEILKTEILENPYNYRFICDIEIHKDAKGKIGLYRAFNYIDKFELTKD
ncbi:hypothetical protein [Campylobacter suis]|uniref:Uncharacterized protein n=1 Tax=Campylobacter suis TaxID=2790657 RepID=A0ABN7K749_9BACT|nr:hypothetical protein [Campylobacter suis]CAD7288260.1 hypothetical protein LMG8286_01228 [Campylobacter suis]